MPLVNAGYEEVAGNYRGISLGSCAAKVVPLFKAGDEQVAVNYRRISLGSCVAKVIAMVLAGRFSKFLK